MTRRFLIAPDKFKGSLSASEAAEAIAERYYSGGRKLAAPEVKSLFSSFQSRARELHANHLPEIQERARTLNPASVLSLVRGNTAV